MTIPMPADPEWDAEASSGAPSESASAAPSIGASSSGGSAKSAAPSAGASSSGGATKSAAENRAVSFAALPPRHTTAPPPPPVRTRRQWIARSKRRGCTFWFSTIASIAFALAFIVSGIFTLATKGRSRLLIYCVATSAACAIASWIPEVVRVAKGGLSFCAEDPWEKVVEPPRHIYIVRSYRTSRKSKRPKLVRAWISVDKPEAAKGLTAERRRYLYRDDWLDERCLENEAKAWQIWWNGLSTGPTGVEIAKTFPPA